MSEPTPEQVAIEGVLRKFRLGQTIDEDGEHTIQLIDVLSAPDDGSVETGQREVEDLAVDLVLAIQPILRAAEARGFRKGVERAARVMLPAVCAVESCVHRDGDECLRAAISALPVEDE